MGATNHTPNIELSQFADDDRPTWRGDYNGDMGKIDNSYAQLTAIINNLSSEISNLTARSTFDPINYGATCDGITDDTAAIIAAQNAAKDAANSITHRKYGVRPVVEFSAQTYVALNGVTFLPGLVYRGQGQELTTIKGHITFDSNSHVSDLTISSQIHSTFVSDGVTNTHFNSVCFSGGDNYANVWNNAIPLDTITFKNCRFTNNTNGGNGITFLDGGTPTTHIKDVLVDHCSFDNLDRMGGEVLVRSTDPIVSGYVGVHFTNNKFYSVGKNTTNDAKTALSYSPNPLASDGITPSGGWSLVSGNQVYSGDNIGIEVAGGRRMRVVNNYCEVNGYPYAQSNLSKNAAVVCDGIITGNEFIGSNVVLYGSGWTFADNNVSLTTMCSIVYADKFDFHDNQIESSNTNPEFSALLVDPSCPRANVHHNTISSLRCVNTAANTAHIFERNDLYVYAGGFPWTSNGESGITSISNLIHNHGNTNFGKVVIDSGWRTITSWDNTGVISGTALPANCSPTAGSSGWVRVRRVGQTVYWQFAGLTFTGSATFTAPTGYNCDKNSTLVVGWSNGTVNTCQAGGANVQIGAANLIASATWSTTLSYLTSDVWPSAYPGTAA